MRETANVSTGESKHEKRRLSMREGASVRAKAERDTES